MTIEMLIKLSVVFVFVLAAVASVVATVVAYRCLQEVRRQRRIDR